MLKICRIQKTRIHRTATEKGESIEELIRRMTADKSPIPQNVPPIYTEKKEGVIPDYDIRTDRFEVAMEAQDKFAASERAKGANIPQQEQEQEQEQQKTD